MFVKVSLYAIVWDREVDGAIDTDAQLPDSFSWFGEADCDESALDLAVEAATDKYGFCIDRVKGTIASL